MELGADMSSQVQVLGIAQSFAIALLIGALVGVEREKKKEESQRPSFAGIRTFMLLSEAGALSAWLAQQTAMPSIFGVSLAGLLGLIGLAYVLEKRTNPAAVGLTTELAGLTVFLLGAAVMFGYAAVAVGLAVVNTSLLAFKDPLHGAIQKLGKEDIYAAIKLLIATFIVLPLLPHQTIDPWGALDPYKLWLLVVLISALSLIGYVATRWLGSARGVAITGVTGGLVSSTAVTLSMARESRSNGIDGKDDAYASGILIAWVVMFARVAVMVLALGPALMQPMLMPFIGMLIVNVGFAAWFYWRSMASTSSSAGVVGAVALKNPFSLWAATKFGLLFAVVLLMVALARRSFSSAGLIYVATLAGTTDVDAITLAMTSQAGDLSRLSLSAQAVVVCVLSNTVTKAGLVALLGSHGVFRRIGLATAIMVLTGGVALFLG
jgi:uncharacterized membrane protein (DUF4010 family)